MTLKNRLRCTFLVLCFSLVQAAIAQERVLSCDLNIKDEQGKNLESFQWSSPLVSDSVYSYADVNQVIELEGVQLRFFSRYGLNYRYALLSMSNLDDLRYSTQFDGYVDMDKSFRLAGSLASLGMESDYSFQGICKFLSGQR